MGHGIGHGIRAHHRTCWLNNLAPRYRSEGKIGLAFPSVNRRATLPAMSSDLLLALGCLLAWTALLAFAPWPTGAIHLPLALGATLLVRWWALRA